MAHVTPPPPAHQSHCLLPTQHSPPVADFSLFSEHSRLLPGLGCCRNCPSLCKDFLSFTSPSERAFVPNPPESHSSLVACLDKIYYSKIILLIYWITCLLQLVKWEERHRGEKRKFLGRAILEISAVVPRHMRFGPESKSISCLRRNPPRLEQNGFLMLGCVLSV